MYENTVIHIFKKLRFYMSCQFQFTIVKKRKPRLNTNLHEIKLEYKCSIFQEGPEDEK